MHRLLVFAHRGEAQTFLKEMKLKSHPRLNNLYLSESYSLLITGEGDKEVLSNLSIAIGLLKEVTVIENYGICGSLDKEIPLNEIIEPRTIYGENEFKSFTQTSNSTIDLITTNQRVLEPERAIELSHFATLVDREAFYISFCAKKFNIAFKIIKLISDHISDARFCENIKENSVFYSDRLYQYFLDKKATNLKGLNHTNDYEVFNHKELYFTVSAKRNISQLISSILKRDGITLEELLEIVKIDEIISRGHTPKDRVALLASALKAHLYPFRTKLEQYRNEIMKDINLYQCEVKFDHNFERKDFKFIAHIDSEHSRELAIKALNSLPIKHYQDLVNGDFDV